MTIFLSKNFLKMYFDNFWKLIALDMKIYLNFFSFTFFPFITQIIFPLFNDFIFLYFVF